LSENFGGLSLNIVGSALIEIDPELRLLLCSSIFALHGSKTVQAYKGGHKNKTLMDNYLRGFIATSIFAISSKMGYLFVGC
jgi:hypothetical protein